MLYSFIGRDISPIRTHVLTQKSFVSIKKLLTLCSPEGCTKLKWASQMFHALAK